jgi:hypothetical protein
MNPYYTQFRGHEHRTPRRSFEDLPRHVYGDHYEDARSPSDFREENPHAREWDRLAETPYPYTELRTFPERHRGRSPLLSTEGPFRGIGPKGYKRSDERIEEDVNDHLTEDADIDASDIQCAVRNGEVTLTGTVSGRDVKRRVEDLVESISGVSDVQNNLRVKRSDDTHADSPSGSRRRQPVR